MATASTMIDLRVYMPIVNITRERSPNCNNALKASEHWYPRPMTSHLPNPQSIKSIVSRLSKKSCTAKLHVKSVTRSLNTIRSFAFLCRPFCSRTSLLSCFTTISVSFRNLPVSLLVIEWMTQNITSIYFCSPQIIEENIFNNVFKSFALIFFKLPSTGS